METLWHEMPWLARRWMPGRGGARLVRSGHRVSVAAGGRFVLCSVCVCVCVYVCVCVCVCVDCGETHVYVVIDGGVCVPRRALGDAAVLVLVVARLVWRAVVLLCSGVCLFDIVCD